MTVRLRVKEIAKEKGYSMGKLSRVSDVAYNTIKRMFKVTLTHFRGAPEVGN